MIISNSVWNFKLEKWSKGETIIKFGEVGKIFYILLSGKIDIYKPIELEVEFKDP